MIPHHSLEDGWSGGLPFVLPAGLVEAATVRLRQDAFGGEVVLTRGYRLPIPR